MRRGKDPKSKATAPAGPAADLLTAPAARRMVQALLDWFPTQARDLPWRRRQDAYAVWVSEIMLQQTQVKTVIPYFERWMKELPGLRDLAEVPSEKLHKLWEGLGYYTRVRNLQKAAQKILAEHAGEFPSGLAEILALPGVGRYTAGAVASIAFDQPAPILDGNVIRVLTRLLAVRENPRERAVNELLWRSAERLVQTAATHAPIHLLGRAISPCSALNQSLMELGALVCTPRQPACALCPLLKNCRAQQLGLTAELPNLGPRPTATARRFIAAVIASGDRLLIRQRPAGVVNALLWEFPNVEIPIKASPEVAAAALRRELGPLLPEIHPLTAIQHSITRYRIRLESYHGLWPKGAEHRLGGWNWASIEECRALPFNSAHGKLLRFWLKQQRGESRPA